MALQISSKQLCCLCIPLPVSWSCLAEHPAEAQQIRHQVSMLDLSAFRPFGIWLSHLLAQTVDPLLHWSASSCACMAIPSKAEIHAAEAWQPSLRPTPCCTCALLQLTHVVANPLCLLQSSCRCGALSTTASPLLKLLLHPLLL